MDARGELENLLADLLDGQPDLSRNQRLGELLRAHPDLQGEYLDYLQLHALLQWRGGKVAPQPKTPIEKVQPAPAIVGTSATRWRLGRGVAAALMLVAASVAVFFLWPAADAQATPDLLETLVDWNLDLTQARSRDERSRIYKEQAADLKATVAKAEMPADDRKLAEALLDTSAWLTKAVDPDAEADRFNDLALVVVARMETATVDRDEKRVVQLADAYGRLTEVGVKGNRRLAQATSGLDMDKKRRQASSALRDAVRENQVADIIERHPEPARKVIHRAMKGHFHKTKKHKRAS